MATYRKKYDVQIKRPPDYFKPKNYKHYKTLGELASALHVDPSWLRKLERRGVIARPPTVKRGGIIIRLYSPEAEEEIRQVLQEQKKKSGSHFRD